MTAPHDEGNQNNSKQSGPWTRLESPFHLSELNPAVLTLSVAFTPSGLTSVATAPESLVESFRRLCMSSPSMPILSMESFPGRPPADLHSKSQAETTRRSKTNTMNTIVRAFSSSKTLHQVLGMQKPEPYVTPPEMPHDLRERFEAGLQRYERLYAAGVFISNEVEGVQTARPPQNSNTGLADILEEKDSPVYSTSARPVGSGTSSGLNISVPKWTSRKQAVAVGAQRYISLGSDSDAANDSSSEYTDEDLDFEDYSLREYGSSTTIAMSDYSRPGSSASRKSAPSFPPRTSSLPPHGFINRASILSLRPPKGHTIPPGLLTHSVPLTASENARYSNETVDNLAYSSTSSLRGGRSFPVLFPSPGIEKHCWALEQTRGGGFVASDAGCNSKPSHSSGDNKNLQFRTNTSLSSVPHITVQAPSPKKVPGSRKRALSSLDQNDVSPRVSQRAHRNDTVGLPILPSSTEALWKSEFPGNTHALLTILLTWSQTMWSLHQRLPDAKLFGIHPAFTYPVSPPLARQLLSVSFYDTSTEPHREVRFLGPGDVAEVSYHEVDVFDDPARHPHSQKATQPSFPLGTIKHSLGLAGSESYMHFTTGTQRAKTGEGRWCYILLRAHKTADGDTRPHAILAWPITAITASSTCLHTLSPIPNSTPTPPTPAPAPPSSLKLKRFTSLQHLSYALRTPPHFSSHQSLRHASSISRLAPVEAGTEVPQRGSVTLHRTVLKLERAGGVPLIEGFRVDVGAFRVWLDACGKGEGKVIMWRESSGG